MSEPIKEVAKLSAAGLALGLPISFLAAGIYATWATGGDMSEVGFGAILDHAPPSLSLVPYFEPFFTSLKVGAGAALLTSVAVPLVGYRKKLDSYGAAEWQNPASIKKEKMAAKLRDLNAPIFGKLGSPRGSGLYVTAQGEPQPHSLIVAPTRSGKGVGIVIPTLLTYLGSVVCLDIKGENYRKTSRIRQAMGNEVYKIEPYDADGMTHCFNPLDRVIAARPRFRWAAASDLASCLLADKGGNGGSSSSSDWLGGCRLIFAAAALLAIERKTPTIAAIYDMFTQPDPLPKILKGLGEEVINPEAKRVFHQFAGYEDEQLSSYFSIMNDAGLGLWNDPLVRDVTSKSDFSITELRRDPSSIYIVIAQGQIKRMAPLVRLLFQQIINLLSESEPDTENGEIYPVLFVLDEFKSLGTMDPLVEGITAVGGHGGRLMLVVQNLANLYENYGKYGAETFISNCDIQVYMSPNDKETPEYISASLGEETRTQRSKSWKGNEFTNSYQEREEGKRLMRPEEIRKLAREKVIILVRGMSPIKTNRVTYYKDSKLARICNSQTGDYPDPLPLPDDYDDGYGAIKQQASLPPHLQEPKPQTDGQEATSVPEEAASENVPASGQPKEQTQPDVATESGAADAQTDEPVSAGTAQSDESEQPAMQPSPDVAAENGAEKASEASGHPDDNMDDKKETRVFGTLSKVVTNQKAAKEGLDKFLEETSLRNKKRHLLNQDGKNSQDAAGADSESEEESPPPEANISPDDIAGALSAVRDLNSSRMTPSQ